MEKHGKYNFNAKQMRILEEQDGKEGYMSKDTLSRVDNVWQRDPWEWLRKVKILKEKKY